MTMSRVVPFFVPWMLRVIEEYALTKSRTVWVSAATESFEAHARVSVEATEDEVDVDTSVVLLEEGSVVEAEVDWAVV